jgi:hypothetical protein
MKGVGERRHHPLQKVEWKLGTAHATRTGLDVGDDNTETLPPVHAVWSVGIDNHGSPSRVTEEGPEGGKRAKERVRKNSVIFCRLGFTRASQAGEPDRQVGGTSVHPRETRGVGRQRAPHSPRWTAESTFDDLG